MSQYHRTPWQVSPLQGKYYGTDIVDADGCDVCRIWDHDRDGPDANRPSARELAKYGPFGSDAERDEFWREYCCDSHYESVGDLAVAEFIVAAVNRS